jgi:hypothetical protein
MIFVRLISTCRFAGLSSIIVALRVEFNFAIHMIYFYLVVFGIHRIFILIF